MKRNTTKHILSQPYYLLVILFLLPLVGMTKNNPVMVINCFVDALNEDPIALAAMVMTFPCDMDGTCPEGTVPVDFGESCDCVPDCSMVVPYDQNNCDICDMSFGGSVWQDAQQYCGCEIDPIDLLSIGCGCPPWFSPIIDISVGFTGCEIPDIPCFDGDIVWESAGECGIPDEDGLVTTTITIFLDILGDGSTTPGYALTIADLQNCTLTSGENFVLELANQYGANAAFVDDDNDGEIILEFLRDPTLPTVIDFDNDNQDISLPVCAPIPTMGTWAVIILGFLMTILGLVVVSRKSASRLDY